MPLGTTPVPMHSGQAMPSWATMALRMNADLFGSLLRNSAKSSSTLKATICDFGDLRGMAASRESAGYGLMMHYTPIPAVGLLLGQRPQHLQGRLALRVVVGVVQRQRLGAAGRSQRLLDVPRLQPPAQLGRTGQFAAGVGADAPVVVRPAVGQPLQVL